jgi:Ca-activated chloride channel homolog
MTLKYFVSTLIASSFLLASPVKFDVDLSHTAIKADQTNKVYLRVKLTGKEVEKKAKRTPLNVSLVLDRSGSMSGEKMARTKAAAISFVKRLASDDIVSIIIYDDRVDVLLPATKIENKTRIINKINAIHVGGSTALHAGVVAGAHEVKKFLDKSRANRVILLSDGQANVGPQTPEALGSLGAKLVKDGISVTTLGLGNGYNEDLMSLLAVKSDGNHKFLRSNSDVEHFFTKELGAIGSIVASNVNIEIKTKEGIKALRVLDLDAKISDGVVKAGFNQIYGGLERYMMLELEVPALKVGKMASLVDVKVSYTNIKTQKEFVETKNQSVAIAIEAKENSDVMISAVEQLAVIANEEAVKLRDQGRIKEAKARLKANSMMLKTKGAAYSSPALMEQASENEAAMDKLDDANWNTQRKQMKDAQTKRSYKGAL